MGIIDFKATKCKHCYKCVRYCDVKAIMIKDERAEIMPDKCILCGHHRCGCGERGRGGDFPGCAGRKDYH